MPKTFHPYFSDNLRHLMGERGLSQTDLAWQIGKQPAHVWKYLNGINEPSLSTLEAIAKALGTTPGRLLRKP